MRQKQGLRLFDVKIPKSEFLCLGFIRMSKVHASFASILATSAR